MNVDRELLVPLDVPLRYFGLGLLHLLALVLLTPVLWPSAQATFLHNSRVLVLTHLYTLGWVTAVIMGAMFQLVGVIAVTKLHSVRLARLQFWLYFPGLYLMLTGFWRAETALLITGGSMVVTAILLFLYNMLRSLLRMEKWSLPAVYLLASLSYLALVAGWGLTLAINMRLGFLQAGATHQLLTHVAWGLLGWFTLTIVGVSYRLLPMFTLSTHKPDGFSYAIAVVLHGAVVLLALCGIFAWGQGMVALAIGLVLVGVSLFVLDSHRMLAKRMKRSLDLSVRFTLTSFPLLVGTLLLILLGLTAVPWLLADAHQTVGLIYLGVMGWVTLMVIGQLYKIVPFLVWAHRYAPLAGLQQVPLTHELYTGWVASVGYWLLLPGVLVVALGTVAGQSWLWWPGALLMIAGVVPVLYNMGEVILHVRQSGRSNAGAAQGA